MLGGLREVSSLWRPVLGGNDADRSLWRLILKRLLRSSTSIEHRALAFCEARKERLQRAYDDMDDLREQYEDEREGPLRS